MSDMPSSYKVYWQTYGGINALLTSNYLGGALIFSILVPTSWLPHNKDGGYDWTATALSITPSMLGFSIGAMAILLTLGASHFRKAIQMGGNASFFMNAVSSFFHFMLVQVIAIFAALFVKAWPYPIFSAIGYVLFVYSILCGLACAAALVALAEIKTKADGIENRTIGSNDKR